MSYEGLRLKVQKYWRKGFGSLRKKCCIIQTSPLSRTIVGVARFTKVIIYRKVLHGRSVFMAEDYIKFLQDLKEYLLAEMTFIKPEQSRWKEQVCSDKRLGSYPVGILKNSRGMQEDNIEIFFLHYHSEKEAKEKWERRVRRINWNHLFVKFNDQNGCTNEHIKAFNKFLFNAKYVLQLMGIVNISL